MVLQNKTKSAPDILIYELLFFWAGCPFKQDLTGKYYAWARSQANFSKATGDWSFRYGVTQTVKIQFLLERY